MPGLVQQADAAGDLRLAQRQAARAQLRAQGLLPSRLEPVGARARAGRSWARGLPFAELSLVTRQLATLLESGLTMEQSLDAFKSGQVAMAMNWFAFFPGLYADPNTGGDKIDFFVNPAQNQPASTLGGQGISVVSYTDNMEGALDYIKWFATPDVQKKWWSMGGYSVHNAVLNDPGFKDSAPFAGDFLEAMSAVQDFWQEPAYAQLLLAMQERLHNYIVADQGTAQEALDGLIADWTEVFEDEGKL